MKNIYKSVLIGLTSSVLVFPGARAMEINNKESGPYILAKTAINKPDISISINMELIWNEVPSALRYNIYADGNFIDWTSGLRYRMPSDTTKGTKLTVKAVDSNGAESDVSNEVIYSEGILAFPGAEGHGKFTTGGRGGKIYKVTTLEDTGKAGSFRYAIEQRGPRVILFEVAGTIKLKSNLRLNNGDVTIAGQTSPGGICIADYEFQIRASNVIIRFLRFRPGDVNGEEPDGLGAMDQSNIMVDHCSISWSVDECLSIYGNRFSTVQWCMAYQALRISTHGKGTHCYGGNWGGEYATYHHNLIAHCESRTPRLGPRPGTQMNEKLDLRNNVFYNWAGNGCYGGEGMDVNIVNNYYKPGPATDAASSAVKYRIAAPGIRTISYCQNSDGSWNAWYPMLHHWGKLYVDGNVPEGYPDVTKDNWTKGIYAQISSSGNDGTYTQATKDSIRLSRPWDDSKIKTYTAVQAYEQVLGYAGASNHRDRLDSLIVDDVRNRKATYTASGNKKGFINTPNDTRLPNESSYCPNLPKDFSSKYDLIDSDGDGIPDYWEDYLGSDANDASDADWKNSQGYTNFEAYLYGLVSSITYNQTRTDLGPLNIKDEYVANNKIQIFGLIDIVRVKNVPDNTDVNIYNLNGTLVHKETISQDYSKNLPKGVYIVSAADMTRKITIR